MTAGPASGRRCGAALAVLAGLLLPALAAAQQAADWAAATTPRPGPPQSIGTPTLGCLAGAVALPSEGPGWQAVRLSRNRHWGHPATVAAIADLARRATAAGLPDLWIGDIAQPRGGPLPFGHASHQTGLDVDVWLDVTPKPPAPPAARENIAVASLVRADEQAVDAGSWRPAHATLIRLAAEIAGVDRVLVHHAIKRALCAAHPGAPWLRRVRPWRGHDSHMHIRLRCPPDDAGCAQAAPPPSGDGCDATLDWWLTDAARQPPSPPTGPPARLPNACAGMLAHP